MTGPKMRPLWCKQNKGHSRCKKNRTCWHIISAKFAPLCQNNMSLAVLKLWSSKRTLVPSIAQLFELWSSVIICDLPPKSLSDFQAYTEWMILELEEAKQSI